MSDTSKKSTPPDALTKTTDENKIELTEEELKRVAGGTAAKGGPIVAGSNARQNMKI
jgi:hypothetical protein